MLNQAVIKKIEEKFGMKLEYGRQCIALSEAIYEDTSERLSETTLKRMFGFTGQECVPHRSSMDILAQYLNYPDWKTLSAELHEDSEISDFSEVEEIVSSDLKEGTQVQITYDPQRLLVLTYLGDYFYIVNESYKSKIQKGDKIRVTHLTIGQPLIVAQIIREGKSLGSYTGAKMGGLTSIEVFS